MFASNNNNNNNNGANANTTNNNTEITSMLSVLLRAARTASAFVRDALLRAADSLRQFITPTTAPTTTTTTPSGLDGPKTAAATTTASLAATSTRAQPAPRPRPTARATTTRRASATTTATTRRARMPPTPTLTDTEIYRRATTTTSIYRTMRAVGVAEEMAAPTIDPAVLPAIVTSPDVPPVFDDLLLPPVRAPPTAAARADLLRNVALNPRLQAVLARNRIQVAATMREVQSPNMVQDPADLACGCGLCPNGTAAYPLCAAVTIRRTIRSFGSRATTSHTATFVRRQYACGRYDPAAVISGGRTRSC